MLPCTVVFVWSNSFFTSKKATLNNNMCQTLFVIIQKSGKHVRSAACQAEDNLTLLWPKVSISQKMTWANTCEMKWNQTKPPTHTAHKARLSQGLPQPLTLCQKPHPFNNTGQGLPLCGNKWPPPPSFSLNQKTFPQKLPRESPGMGTQ